MHTSYDVTSACSAARKPTAFKVVQPLTGMCVCVCACVCTRTHNQPSIERITWGYFRRVKKTARVPSMKNVWKYNSVPSYAFITFKANAVSAAARGPTDRGGGGASCI
jgi:hypothetical protein